jgi:hypothetical protein
MNTIPTPEEYYASHPGKEMFDYLRAYPEGFNLYIGPTMTDKIKEGNNEIGLPLIYTKDGEVVFEYSNGRIEKEFVNELQIICYYKDDLYLTGYLPSIFKKGDRVYVVEYCRQPCSYPSQYGVLENIYFKMNMEETEVTYIGWNFLVKLSGIDKSVIPTFEQYFDKTMK